MYLRVPSVVMQAPELLTAAEAAEILDVNVETVRRWIRKGVLHPARRLGRGSRTMLHRGEVLELAGYEPEPRAVGE